uniref:Uncharacterized protein n=1 Tax=Rhizophora mucronata TaxID=61149 RepID=A0A2P2P8T8_RHIMU
MTNKFVWRIKQGHTAVHVQGHRTQCWPPISSDDN